MSTQKRIILEMLLVIGVIVVAILDSALLGGWVTSVSQLFLLTLLVGILTGVLVPMLFLMFKVFRVEKSYHVAVIGFPKSGKTTLITSLFGEAFKRNLPVNVTPRGTQTIERINKSLEMLKKGKALGPTRDQDMFAFRADATFGRWPFRSTYRIEFGDFPGKYSEDHYEDKGPLHNTEFFKWVADSDAMIFVIDLGRYLSRLGSKNGFIAETTASFRAEWQQFLDTNSFRIKEVKRHAVIIVFNKADLMYRYSVGINLGGIERMTDSSKVRQIEEMAARLGFGEDAPPTIEIDGTQFDSDKKIIENEFAELISYFETEVQNTDVVFTSSFATLKGSTSQARIGIGRLFVSVLKGAI